MNFQALLAKTFLKLPDARLVKMSGGKPLTIDDVIFSFEAFKKNHPFYNAYYAHVTKVAQTGEREVMFTFDSTGNRELPLPPQARVFEQPGLAKELWTVHVLSIGDLDARYIGGRTLLEPLFASYGMPANSDYAPLLDLNAARHRFTERSATDLVALLNLDVPLLEMLEPTRSRRPAASSSTTFRGRGGSARPMAIRSSRTASSRSSSRSACPARARPRTRCIPALSRRTSCAT